MNAQTASRNSTPKLVPDPSFGVRLPAHIVAGRALCITDPLKTKSTLLREVQPNDLAKLSRVADFWNSGYDLTSTPKDRGLLVRDGPYGVTSVTADRVVLKANRRYAGAHAPKFERVVVRFISDPIAAVTALTDGSVDVISSQSARNLVAAIRAVPGAKIASGFDGAWECLDRYFVHSRNSSFARELTGTPLRLGMSGSSRYAKVDVAAARALLDAAGVTAPRVCILFDPSNPAAR